MRINKPRKYGFFAMLLALLGIGGCQDLPEEEEMRLMYGTPTAQFSVKGKVTDEKGNAIQGLQVILGNRFYDNSSVTYDHHYFPVDTLTTDSDGVYQFESSRISPIENLQVDVNDIDGAAGGGEFNSATTVVRNIEYKDGNGWYRGKADIKVSDIKLEKK
jgi:putative lipoprotein (rSAM/lipoprotein system)